MKTIVILGFSLMSLVSVSLMSAESAFAARVDRRELRQNARIGQGEQNGSLTNREQRRLMREQRHIERAKERMEKSGGGLDEREKAKLERMQDKASRDIYRLKHNGRNQGNEPGKAEGSAPVAPAEPSAPVEAPAPAPTNP